MGVPFGRPMNTDSKLKTGSQARLVGGSRLSVGWGRGEKPGGSSEDAFERSRLSKVFSQPYKAAQVKPSCLLAS